MATACKEVNETIQLSIVVRIQAIFPANAVHICLRSLVVCEIIRAATSTSLAVWKLYSCSQASNHP